MKISRWTASTLMTLWIATSPTSGLLSESAASRSDGEVVLPLTRYERLLEAVEQAELRRAAAQQAVEEPVAQLERIQLGLHLTEAGLEVSSRWTATVSGSRLLPVELATLGLIESVAVLQPQSAVRRSADESAGPLQLVAAEAGSYEVEARSFLDLPRSSGSVWSFELPPLRAAMRSIEFRLPAQLIWQAPGVTLVAERVEELPQGGGPERVLELTVPRDRAVRFELRRPFEQAGDDRAATVRAYSATLFHVRREGVHRVDLSTFDVARGELDRHQLELPEDLDPETVTSDEGRPATQRDGRELTVYRERVIDGHQRRAFVRLHTPLGRVREASLEAVSSRFAPRAHYLLVRSDVAADFAPANEGLWLRRDVGDLPSALAALVDAAGASVWRWQGDGSADGELRVEVLPEAEGVGAVVRRRVTTTLLTADGSLVHRDRLQVVGRSSALELLLPEGSELWSMLVDGEPTRPLQGPERANRQTLFAPLSLGNDGTRNIEVVLVQPQALLAGRSQLELVLPTVETQVLEHQWRLLLPEGRRYRYAGGDLRRIVDRQEAPQLQPGSLSGRVADGSGAVLPGVEVTLLDADGRQRRLQISDARGWFTFADVPPGRYEVTAGLAGFGSVSYPVRLRRERGFFVDVRLTPRVEETITVTSEAPLLDERQTQAVFAQAAKEKRDNLFRQELLELEKIPTAEDPWALMSQTPGVLVDRASAGIESRSGSARRSASGGQRGEQQHFDSDQGRLAGVRPLPVHLPERGKLLQLAGVLPGSTVRAVLDVRDGRRSP